MLRIEKLTYEWKGRLLLKGISFQVRAGELLAVLGANGAGKSTLLKLISGECKPTSGTVDFNGKQLSSYSVKELAQCRSMLTQNHSMSISYKVSDILIMGRYPHFTNIPTDHDYSIIDEVSVLCGINMFVDRDYLSLSGGEQQRVQLARVLIQIWDRKNSLLLLDEPISALDLHYQQKTLAIAKALTYRGFAVVVVLHDVNFAATYADRIVMLKNGRKLFDGTPIEVLNKKEMYTIYGVESQIEVNTKTLKPYVRIEEMVVDL